MDNKTKRIYCRFTTDEYVKLCEQAKSYGSVSSYIRCCIKEKSNIDVKRHLELLNDIHRILNQYNNHLAHMGGNLNQYMKRANELNAAGLLSGVYIDNVATPIVKECNQLLSDIRDSLNQISKIRH